jgi:glucan phosphoethanolaminetransferase (alkaline phosphatase superfamily)
MGRRLSLTASPNPIATTHLPFFITVPGETDVLFNITLWFVVACIILTGVVFLTIHSLPERMAHKSKKILLDLIALLCLLALLTHQHLFWFVAIILAFIDIPDFLTPVNRIASSVESMAGQEAREKPGDVSTSGSPAANTDTDSPEVAKADQPRPQKKGALHA